MRFNMNTHKPVRKKIYRTLLKKILSSPYGLLRMTRMGGTSMRHPETLSVAKGTQDLINHLFSRLPRPTKGLAMTRSGGLLIAVLCLLPLCSLLTGCGRKMPPKPPEDAVITYPRPYPNPKLEEWAITDCPPVLELCSPEELCEEYPPVAEECSPEGVCEE